MVSKKLKSREDFLDYISNNHISLYFRIISYIRPSNRSALLCNLVWSLVAYIHKIAICVFEYKNNIGITFYSDVANRILKSKQVLDCSTNRVPAEENLYDYVDEVFSGREELDVDFFDIARIVLTFSGNGTQDLDIIVEELSFEYGLIYKTLSTNKDLFTPPS